MEALADIRPRTLHLYKDALGYLTFKGSVKAKCT